MFGGMNININGIDPKQMQECVGCPLYTLNGYNGNYCENALVRLSAQSEQKSS